MGMHVEPISIEDEGPTIWEYDIYVDLIVMP